MCMHLSACGISLCFSSRSSSTFLSSLHLSGFSLPYSYCLQCEVLFCDNCSRLRHRDLPNHNLTTHRPAPNERSSQGGLLANNLNRPSVMKAQHGRARMNSVLMPTLDDVLREEEEAEERALLSLPNSEGLYKTGMNIID